MAITEQITQEVTYPVTLHSRSIEALNWNLRELCEKILNEKLASSFDLSSSRDLPLLFPELSRIKKDQRALIILSIENGSRRELPGIRGLRSTDLLYRTGYTSYEFGGQTTNIVFVSGDITRTVLLNGGVVPVIESTELEDNQNLQPMNLGIQTLEYLDVLKTLLEQRSGITVYSEFPRTE